MSRAREIQKIDSKTWPLEPERDPFFELMGGAARIKK